MYNKLKSVELLLKHDADSSVKDNDQKTALDYAVEEKFEAIEVLLK
jgi:hypothetical protein